MRRVYGGMGMNRPLLLDLFCGAGGAAMGYHRAGFDVVGIDRSPQKRYPFPFIEGGALQLLEALIEGDSIDTEYGATYYLADFSAIHASPPCQAYTSLRHIAKRNHPDLIDPTRELLIKTGLPWIIENVPGAPINAMLMLCGTMFGLRTNCGAELQRHRYFETNWWFELAPECQHGQSGVNGVYGEHQRDRRRTITVAGDCPRNMHADNQIMEAKRRVIGIYGNTPENPATGGGHTKSKRNSTITVTGDHPRDASAELKNRKARSITVTGHTATGNTPSKERRRTISVTGSTAQQNTVHNLVRETFTVQDARDAMGIDWMIMKELSQAIPPAYTEYIGRSLLNHIGYEEEDECTF
jgi:DNA (cytosine-5)-methyltransferase 1